MFACLFWAVQFLMLYKSASADKRIMFWFMLTATFLYFAHVCYFERHYSVLSWSDSIYSFANLAVYPLYFLYVQKVTRNVFSTTQTLLLLSPAFLVFAANVAGYISNTPAQREFFFRTYLYRESMGMMPEHWSLLNITHTIARFVFPVQVIFAMSYSVKMIKDFSKRIEAFYADPDSRNLNFLSTLMWFMIATSVCSLLCIYFGKSFFVSNNFLLAFPSAAFSVLLFLIGWDAYRRSFSESVFATDREAADSNVTENNRTQFEDELIENFKILLDKEKIHLKPDLKVSDLTNLLHTNRNYLNKALAQHYNASFADIINKARIEHARQLLDDHPDISLYDVMLQSGYTTESTFYRNYKKFLGKTPKAHR